MGALANARHERFAQELAKGKTQTEAYVEAGYKPDDGNATRLTGNDRVQARVAELQAKAASRAVLTLESHLNDLAELRDKAATAKQYSAAITAEIARGKASGVHVEKSEHLVTTKELPASVDEFV
jgi:phage terminase small subunit